MSQHELTINNDALGPLLELLERRGILSWSDRGRVFASPDSTTALLDALENKRVMTWSSKVAIRDLTTLLITLEQRRLITWSDRCRLTMADEANRRS